MGATAGNTHDGCADAIAVLTHRFRYKLRNLIVNGQNPTKMALTSRKTKRYNPDLIDKEKHNCRFRHYASIQ